MRNPVTSSRPTSDLHCLSYSLRALLEVSPCVTACPATVPAIFAHSVPGYIPPPLVGLTWPAASPTINIPSVTVHAGGPIGIAPAENRTNEAAERGEMPVSYTHL